MPGPSPTARIARLAMAGTALVIALALALPPCPPALAAGVPIVVAGEAQEARAGAPLSSYIDTSARPAFEDRFATFDHGTDQAPPLQPHRWRTVYGYGGAFSMANRHMSSTSFGSDAAFAGLSAGGPGTGPGAGPAPGPRPLGLDPFVHRPGMLTIMAHRTPDRARLLAWNKPYYGGIITTKFSFAQRYGYFEIDARLPVGKGMWPAFWLMPIDGAWPESGEIDVFEGLGDPRSVYCTVIAGRTKVSRRIRLSFDASAGFHRYGVLWRPDVIVWFIDGREVSRAATPPALTRTSAYLIANLAIGGAWGGFPDAKTVFPGRYAIRRISVWPLR
ncbi:glycoside hydrolase family 16 protein [Novosphingobium colocasiae]|nr:glycoside hydrolase family 16 protein [Novosphingobium colocasiae]